MLRTKHIPHHSLPKQFFFSFFSSFYFSCPCLFYFLSTLPFLFSSACFLHHFTWTSFFSCLLHSFLLNVLSLSQFASPITITPHSSIVDVSWSVSIKKKGKQTHQLLCNHLVSLLGELTDYIEGRSQVPLPIYFIGDYRIDTTKHLLSALKDLVNPGFKMDGLKVCQNLFWLKGSDKFNLHGTFHKEYFL